MENKDVENSSAKHCTAGPGPAFSSLPEGCIADVLALTSPRDACRMSAVAKVFLSAAESDALWLRFLPPDYRQIMARSSDSSPWPRFPSKKELYFALCNFPFLIDGGRKRFWLEKRSGKKCCLLGSRELTITWGDTPHYWEWMPCPESRFAEVAFLNAVCWFEIRVKLNTSILSPRTNYAAYLVFQTQDDSYGFEGIPVESSIEMFGNEASKRIVYLATYESQENAGQGHGLGIEYEYVTVEDVRNWLNDHLGQLYSSQEPGKEVLGLEDVKAWMNSNLMKLVFPHQEHVEQPPPAYASATGDSSSCPKRRSDGWLEVELGELFIQGGEDMEVEMSLMEVKSGHWKNGVLVEGIEIRPKHDQ